MFFLEVSFKIGFGGNFIKDLFKKLVRKSRLGFILELVILGDKMNFVFY